MNTLAIRILMQAQIKVMCRTPLAQRASMAVEFSHVRNNLDKYRNTAHLRQFFSSRR